MSRNRKDLALSAASAASKVRRDLGCSMNGSICVFDLCEKLGVSVLFQDIPSMEGIYMPDARPRPVIIVSAVRPAGRKAITCGHELGHHALHHGRRWDELVEERSQARRFDPDEFQADVFSACLQMPRVAMSHALSVRGIDPNRASAEQMFSVASFFGVSYGALLTHLEVTLGLLSMRAASSLASRKPRDIRDGMIGRPCPENLVVVDFAWQDRAIDAEVGDSLLLPPDLVVEGSCIRIDTSDAGRTIAVAIKPGLGKVSHSDNWSSFVRVAPRNYVGRAIFRFDDEAEE